MTVQTFNLRPDVAHAVGIVGRVVTYRERQYVVHSVEGADWYVFEEKDGTLTVDLHMTEIGLVEPVATVVPSGSVIGEGFAREVPLRGVRRGVCLAKW